MNSRGKSCLKEGDFHRPNTSTCNLLLSAWFCYRPRMQNRVQDIVTSCVCLLASRKGYRRIFGGEARTGRGPRATGRGPWTQDAGRGHGPGTRDAGRGTRAAGCGPRDTGCGTRAAGHGPRQAACRGPRFAGCMMKDLLENLPKDEFKEVVKDLNKPQTLNPKQTPNPKP